MANINLANPCEILCGRNLSPLLKKNWVALYSFQTPRNFPGTVHTGVNFVDKSEHCPTVRFVRVTYVRPSSLASAIDDPSDYIRRTLLSCQPSTAAVEPSEFRRCDGVADASTSQHDTASTAGRYASPTGFSYKTLLPAPVRIAMCSGRPEYETLASTLERSRTWLKLVG